MGSRRSPLSFSGPQPLRLFRLFGIQFTANWSWLLLFALLVYVGYATFRGLRLGFSQVELFLLGGMAHITRESPTPRAEFMIAIVGPVTSIALGLVGALVSWGLWGVSP